MNHFNPTHRSAVNNHQRISIVVAVLNGMKTIERCLQSIFHQTYSNTELIIMDGNSMDGTQDVLISHSDKITYWESAPDNGIYHAWNKALTHVTGEWICFLGADDCFWNKHVLTDLYPYLEQAALSGIRVVYGQSARVDRHGNVVKIHGKPWEKIAWIMRHGMTLQHTGLMHHRSLFDQHGLFDSTFRIAGDYEFLLRELKNGQALYVDGIRTVACQVGGTADSSNILHHKEVFRARKMNGLCSFSLIWTIVFTRAILRRLYRKFLNRAQLDRTENG